MTLKQTVALILNNEAITDNQALTFATEQFGVLCGFIQDQVLREKFPNGITGWAETYYMVVAEIEVASDMPDEAPKRIEDVLFSNGQPGLWELAKDLTDKFEKENAGVVWGEEKDYHETFEVFIKKEIYDEQ